MAEAQRVNTLNPHYNVVIGRRRLYRVITRTALYWNATKMLISLRCHIIISLVNTDIALYSIFVASAENLQPW